MEVRTGFQTPIKSNDQQFCVAAPNINVFIFGRAFQGVGAAGMMVSYWVLLSRVTRPEQRAFLMNFTGSAFLVSCIAGPLVGGAFADTPSLTWRWCFYIKYAELPLLSQSLVLTILWPVFHSGPSPSCACSSLSNLSIQYRCPLEPVHPFYTGFAISTGLDPSFVWALQLRCSCHYNGAESHENGVIR